MQHRLGPTTRPSFAYGSLRGRCAALRFFALALALLAAAPARAADFEREVPAEPGGRLRVDVDGGRVQIETHNEDTVRVEAHTWGFRAGAGDFELRRDGDEVELHGSFGALSFLGGPKVEVRVRVPEAFSAEVRTGGGAVQLEQLEGRVAVRTGGGRVEVDEITGDVEVRSSGGEVRVSEVEGRVEVRSSGGGVRASDVSGAVEIRTSGGDLRIHDVGGPVDARTSGGNISVRFLAEPAGTLETSGGSVEVEFEEGHGVDLDARTSGGRIDLDDLALEGRVEGDEVRARLGGGGDSLQIRTSGGNIRIRAR